jgi:hypothetical protein
MQCWSWAETGSRKDATAPGKNQKTFAAEGTEKKDKKHSRAKTQRRQEKNYK